MPSYWITSHFTYHLLISITLSFLFLPSILSHPLCLDAEPPFSYSSNETSLDFCVEYSTFGCCTRNDDRRIQEIYEVYLNTTTTNCSSYLRTLLCLECSPYAAHLYDAEGATTTTSRKYFPGLCPGYCSTLYRTCKDIIPIVSTNSGIHTAVNAGEQSFCNAVKISDMTYCYPDIINNTDLNREIDRQQSSEAGCLCLEPFATQLRNALILVYPKDGTGRLFVGEQLGLVSIYYKNGTRHPELFMDISSLVLTSSSPGDERGFLGMVCHPNFSINQCCYVYFTIGTDGNFRTRISEFTTMATNPNKINVTSERVLLEIDQPFSNHNGGEMLFGFDGYLYVTVGDGGAGGDPYNNAQNLSTLLGKILRIDVNARTNNRQYAIPPTNPFINTPHARPEIYAYGLRNTWRCSFDNGDHVTGVGRGRLICGDVGQSRYEEIDIIKSGLNYGWRAREGFECYDSSMCGRIGPEELPIFAYGRDLGQSVTGGYVYRGCRYPSLNGLYIYGDYSSGRIFRLKDIGQPVWENKELLMCQPQYCTNGLKNTYERNILSFGEDFDGDVYMLTTNNPSPTSYSGSIYRIVDPLRRNDPALCSQSAQSSSTPSSSSISATHSTSSSITHTPTTTSTTPHIPTSLTFMATPSTSRVTNTHTTPRLTTSTKIDFTSDFLTTERQDHTSTSRNTFSQITPTRSSTTTESGENFSTDITTEIRDNDSTIFNLSYSPDASIHGSQTEYLTSTSGILATLTTSPNTVDSGSSSSTSLVDTLRPSETTTFNATESDYELLDLSSVSNIKHPSAADKHTSPITSTTSEVVSPANMDNISSTDQYTILDTFPTSEELVLTKVTFTTTVASTTEDLIPTTLDESSEATTATVSQQTLESTDVSVTTEGNVGNDSPVIWSCDFEDKSGSITWCGLEQATNDQFDWTILNGPTPSDPTGPDQAYTGQYYIYIEASNPRKPNDTAKIYLPIPPPNGPATGQFCLSFAYHMFGFHIREIRLIIENSSDGTRKIWSQQKEKGNFWLTAAVTLNIKSGDKVAFVGIRGDEYSGDIALDDLKLQNGRC